MRTRVVMRWFWALEPRWSHAAVLKAESEAAARERLMQMGAEGGQLFFIHEGEAPKGHRERFPKELNGGGAP